MQSGDTVQVQQSRQWIYAKVIAANADGSAFVQITHPGNIQHGDMISFPADQVRDKAAVQKLLDEMPPQAIGVALVEKRALQSQLEWLS